MNSVEYTKNTEISLFFRGSYSFVYDLAKNTEISLFTGFCLKFKKKKNIRKFKTAGGYFYGDQKF